MTFRRPEQCVDCAPVARPSARYITNIVHRERNVESPDYTHLVAIFGQFIDHDIILVPEEEDKCCEDEEGYSGGSEACLNIEIPNDDAFYRNPRQVKHLKPPSPNLSQTNLVVKFSAPIVIVSNL